MTYGRYIKLSLFSLPLVFIDNTGWVTLSVYLLFLNYCVCICPSRFGSSTCRATLLEYMVHKKIKFQVG